MKYIAYIILIVLAFSLPAFSQVDTLQAIEVGIIQAPDSITQLYIQDLNGDSLKELILCTQNHVYAYNQADSLPFWTSPELVRPTDLQFADIDGDSLLDVSVKDSANISLFNMFTPSLIYAMATDGLYRCYTIGDANDDENIDLAVVRQEPFEIGNRDDSVWVSICYGPNYIARDNIYVTMENWHQVDPHYGFFSTHTQRAKNILITPIGPTSVLAPRIIITSIIWQYTMVSDSYEWNYGGICIINPHNFNIVYSDDIGLCDSLSVEEIYNNRVLYTPQYFSYTWNVIGSRGFIRRQKISRYNLNGLIDSTTIINSSFETSGAPPTVPGWSYSLGELDIGRSGQELCFGYCDSLKAFSISNRLIIWAALKPADSIRVNGIFNSNLFQSPEILVNEILPTPQYLFVNGITHLVNTVLPNVISQISNISDLNNDGNDEILSLSGNTLHIYDLEWATPVAERPILPGEYLTVSNYPNPFNAQTIIKYNLPNQCDMALEIYDILGRKIESIEKSNQPAGLGQITWDASGEPSGVYFYRLSAASDQKSGRMVLLK